MHDQPSKAGEAGDAAAEDLSDQAAVLALVLSLHPQSLTLAELVRELWGGDAEFVERDRIERAVRDLTGVGLLRQVAGLIFPTRAAVAFDAIRELS